MNQKQIIVVVIGGVIAVGLILMGSGGRAPTPPIPPDAPLSAMAQTAANDMATFASAAADNSTELAKRLRSGDIKTSDAALKWIRTANDDAREKAFQPSKDELQKAVEAGDLNKLADLQDEIATGFKSLLNR